MPSTTAYALTMLAAGIGIPILAALNAALGTKIGSPVAAATILFTVALSISVVAVLIHGAAPLAKAVHAPKHLLLGGAFIAFYVLAVTFVAPSFGVGNAIFFVLLGQLISAAIIDHYGLFGARLNPLSLNRSIGIALMAAGVFMAQKA
ncbi:DMT family transporter [Thalassovita taeanensis]|uniref:Transporter family-2 protein n=1 Tax=Thalassovita taeanensis TaxID=657014 RepID=A0A1H9EIL6_9RHOB|nr:DMT family transporter [Thalassovita taeanensis]SEQ25455.1 transporter family-2 protein [Thalassovita taeanensis]